VQVSGLSIDQRRLPGITEAGRTGVALGVRVCLFALSEPCWEELHNLQVPLTHQIAGRV
jgi:hypothetical protein